MDSLDYPVMARERLVTPRRPHGSFRQAHRHIIAREPAEQGDHGGDHRGTGRSSA